MTRTARVPQRGRTVRRGMEWTGAATSVSTIAGGAVVPFYIVLPSQVNAYTNPTLVRSRGMMSWRGITNNNVFGAFGLIAWSDVDDLPPAGGDIPAPYTRPDLDWIYHTYFYFLSGATSADAQSHLEIDSKAMRKLKIGEGVLAVIQNASAFGMPHGVGIRCLIKE